MSRLDMWNLIVGFALPPLLAVVQQTRWADSVRALLAFAASVAASGVTVWLAGTLTAQGWTTGALTVLVAAVTTYHGFWKPTRVAPTIERATSPSPPTRDRVKHAAKRTRKKG